MDCNYVFDIQYKKSPSKSCLKESLTFSFLTQILTTNRNAEMQAKFSLSQKEIPPYSNKMCFHQPQAIMDFFMLDILISPMRFQHEIFAILVKSRYCSIASKISRALY